MSKHNCHICGSEWCRGKCWDKISKIEQELITAFSPKTFIELSEAILKRSEESLMDFIKPKEK